MPGEANWRTPTNAFDYLNQQQKKLGVADRRPVPRQASDLVGPGINASATRITDFNDLLATYNGYYAAASPTANAPVIDRNLIGIVTSDEAFGGTQVFYEFSPMSEDTPVRYERMFFRAIGDPSTVTFGAWVKVVAGDARLPWVERYASATAITSSGGTFYPTAFGTINYTDSAPGVIDYTSIFRAAVEVDGLYYVEATNQMSVAHRLGLGTSGGGFSYGMDQAVTDPSGTYRSKIVATRFIAAGGEIWVSVQQNSGSSVNSSATLRVGRLSGATLIEP